MKVIINLKTESRYPVNRKKIREKVIETLFSQNIKRDCEVGISFVGNRKMAYLNQKYLNRKGSTDVLAFPLQSEDKISKRGTPEAPSGFINPPDGFLHLGDIVISYPMALIQAAENNILVDEEINCLVEHGILHLLGIHHDGD